jgi:hypothetical protein
MLRDVSAYRGRPVDQSRREAESKRLHRALMPNGIHQSGEIPLLRYDMF